MYLYQLLAISSLNLTIIIINIFFIREILAFIINPNKDFITICKKYFLYKYKLYIINLFLFNF